MGGNSETQPPAVVQPTKVKTFLKLTHLMMQLNETTHTRTHTNSNKSKTKHANVLKTRHPSALGEIDHPSPHMHARPLHLDTSAGSLPAFPPAVLRKGFMARPSASSELVVDERSRMPSPSQWTAGHATVSRTKAKHLSYNVMCLEIEVFSLGGH